MVLGKFRDVWFLGLNNYTKELENHRLYLVRGGFFYYGSTINVGVFAQKRAKKMHAGSFIHYP